MKIEGIISAMVTPFDSKGELDYSATEHLIDFLIESGVNGIFILGTNGEAHVLSDSEKVAFTMKVCEYVNQRVIVLAGSGANSTQETINLSKKMVDAGADVLSIVPPSFVKYSQEELIEHYITIASKVSSPIIIYNMPKLTGNPIEPESLRLLAEIPNIVGVKDSSGDIANIQAYIDVTPESFSVLSGSDSLILKTLQSNGAGAVAATTNLIAPIVIDIYNSFISGNISKAEMAQAMINPLRSVLKLGSVPSIIKRTMCLAGLSVGEARKPAKCPSYVVDKEIQKIIEIYSQTISWKVW